MLRLKGKLRLTKREAKIDFSYSFEPTKDLSTFSEVQFHHIGIQPILKQLFLTASSQSSLRIELCKRKVGEIKREVLFDHSGNHVTIHQSPPAPEKKKTFTLK